MVRCGVEAASPGVIPGGQICQYLHCNNEARNSELLCGGMDVKSTLCSGGVMRGREFLGTQLGLFHIPGWDPPLIHTATLPLRNTAKKWIQLLPRRVFIRQAEAAAETNGGDVSFQRMFHFWRCAVFQRCLRALCGRALFTPRRCAQHLASCKRFLQGPLCFAALCDTVVWT